MVQIFKVTGQPRNPLPIPDWLKNPVSGEEAQRRARQYQQHMQRIAEGRDTPE